MALLDNRYSQSLCPEVSVYVCLFANFRRYKAPGNRLTPSVAYVTSSSPVTEKPRELGDFKGVGHFEVEFEG